MIELHFVSASALPPKQGTAADMSTRLRVKTRSMSLLALVYVAIAVCVVLLPDQSSAQESRIPADFSLYVSEQSELYEFAPPHPCGRVLVLRANKVPQDLPTFTILPAVELNENGDILARWPLPVDAVPTAVVGDSLAIRLSESRQSVFLSTSGDIGLPVEGGWPEEGTKAEPNHVDCPVSADSFVSQYFCITLADQASGQRRIIGYPPTCT